MDFAARCQLAGWDISRGIVAAIEGRVRWAGDFEAAILAQVLRTSIISLFPEQPDWTEFSEALQSAGERKAARKKKRARFSGQPAPRRFSRLP